MLPRDGYGQMRTLKAKVSPHIPPAGLVLARQRPAIATKGRIAPSRQDGLAAIGRKDATDEPVASNPRYLVLDQRWTLAAWWPYWGQLEAPVGER